MTPAWALRPAEGLRDGVVSPAVFNHGVDRRRDVVVPSHHVLATAAGKRPVHLDLEGVLSHGPRQHADESAALVAVARLVLPDGMGTAPWDHRPLVQVLVGEVVHRGGHPRASSPAIPAASHSGAPTRWGCPGHGVASGGRLTTAQGGSPGGPCPAPLRPCATAAGPCPRTGRATSTDVRPGMCPRTCRIVRGLIRVWRGATGGRIRCPTAG
jgi:hypothetical protein